VFRPRSQARHGGRRRTHRGLRPRAPHHRAPRRRGRRQLAQAGPPHQAYDLRRRHSWVLDRQPPWRLRRDPPRPSPRRDATRASRSPGAGTRSSSASSVACASPWTTCFRP